MDRNYASGAGRSLRSSSNCHVGKVDVLFQDVAALIISETGIKEEQDELDIWLICVQKQPLHFAVAEGHPCEQRITGFDDKKVGAFFQDEIHGIRLMVQFAEKIP